MMGIFRHVTLTVTLLAAGCKTTTVMADLELSKLLGATCVINTENRVRDNYRRSLAHVRLDCQGRANRMSSYCPESARKFCGYTTLGGEATTTTAAILDPWDRLQDGENFRHLLDGRHGDEQCDGANPHMGNECYRRLCFDTCLGGTVPLDTQCGESIAISEKYHEVLRDVENENDERESTLWRLVISIQLCNFALWFLRAVLWKGDMNDKLEWREVWMHHILFLGVILMTGSPRALTFLPVALVGLIFYYSCCETALKDDDEDEVEEKGSVDKSFCDGDGKVPLLTSAADVPSAIPVTVA